MLLHLRDGDRAMTLWSYPFYFPVIHPNEHSSGHVYHTIFSGRLCLRDSPADSPRGDGTKTAVVQTRNIAGATKRFATGESMWFGFVVLFSAAFFLALLCDGYENNEL